nr:multidrug effflux MFS transporter [uncultured Holophaga sp.]
MTPTEARPGPSTARLITVLAVLSIFPPLATDLYLSAFGEIQQALHTGPATLELSLSVFFLGLCGGQLLFGPLADRLGRKRPLLVGAAVFCAASLLLMLTRTPWVFVALRLVQALGACAGMVIGRAVVTDCFEGADAARVMTLLFMLVTLGPVVAPLLGGLLVARFGWISVFLLMLGVGLLALALAWALLPETLAPEKRVAAPLSQLLGDYGRLLASRDFRVPALASALVLGGVFAFITASPRVLLGSMGLGRIQYGLAFGLVALGLVVSSFLNNRLLASFQVRTLVDRALPLLALVGLVLLAVSGTRHLALLLAPLWAAVALAGLLSANGTALAMAAAQGRSGAGSALLGALQFGVAFACSSGVALLDLPRALPLALGVTVPALLALALWRSGRQREALVPAQSPR